jgi:hypothetical protein
MADQYDDITRLLGKMGLSPDWHVVEPVRGDLKSTIWIQNVKQRLDVRFPPGPSECDDLKDDEKERRIREAIEKALKPMGKKK